jgi:hypothetical protein
MKQVLHIFSLVLMLAGASLLFEQQAHAYTDPGTGLLVVQAVGSSLVAAGWYLRRKIYTLFHRGTTSKDTPDAGAAAKEDEDSSLS